jgi:hypothetical protein
MLWRAPLTSRRARLRAITRGCGVPPLQAMERVVEEVPKDLAAGHAE